MGKIGFMRGFLFCLEEKFGKQNSKGNGLVIHNLELKESYSKMILEIRGVWPAHSRDPYNQLMDVRSH